MWPSPHQVYLYCLILGLLFMTRPVFGDETAVPLNFHKTTFDHVATDSLQLPHRAIVPLSEEVWFNDSLAVRDVDYTIHYLIGVARLKKPVVTLITISYRYIPDLHFEPYRRFQPVRLDSLGRSLTSSRVRNQSVDSWLGAAALSIGGSKTIGIEVGSNRDLSLEQSLRVNITGQVSQDVSVIALLTDENSPIQPEGNTTELEELDKVLIQIKSPHLEGTLGDFDVLFSGTALANYQRDLQGVRGDGMYDWAQFTLAAAVSRGEYHTNEFYGQEGNQGPYQLTADDGSDNIVILAGTEEVWINGERLRRGETGDYTMDYAAARLTFTANRLITAQSRIVVDFQYSNQTYTRSFYVGEVQKPFWQDRVKVGIRLVQESDNQDRPIEVVLTNTDRDSLKLAGDDRRAALRSGAESAVGVEGDYALDPVTGAYVYVRPDSAGDYTVRFSFVGPGQGDYVRSAQGTHFEFVGDGQGDYAPIIFLPLPRRQRLVDADVTFANEILSLAGEVALSDLDQNTFSEIDDDDNTGLGLSGMFRLQPQTTKLGKIQVSSSFRHLNDRFAALGRMYEAEYAQQWALDGPNQVISPAETRFEFSTDYSPFSAANLKSSYGYTTRGKDTRSARWQNSLNLAPARWPALTVDFSAQNSTRFGATLERHQERVVVGGQIWKISPSLELIQKKTDRFSAENEQQVSQTDDTYQTVQMSVGTFETRKIKSRFSVNYRIDRNFEPLNSDWQNQSESVTFQNDLVLPDLKGINWHLVLQHRQVDYDDVTTEDASHQLLDNRVSYRSRDRVWNLQWNYKITNTAIQRQVEEYFQAGDNQGSYSYDDSLGVYYYDPNGDYYRRTEDVGDPQQTIDLSSSLRLEFRPYYQHLRDLRTRWWHNFKSETWLRIQEKTNQSDQWAIYLFDWRLYQKDQTTVQGLFFIEETIILFPNSSKGSFELRYRYQDDETNQYVTRHEERQLTHYMARLKTSLLGAWHMNWQVELSTEVEQVLERSEKSTIRSRKFSWESRRKPNWQWEYGADLTYFNQAVNFGDDSQLRGFILRPVLNFSPRLKSRLQTEVSWKYVTQTPQDAILPSSIRGIHKIGATWEWKSIVRHQILANFTASISYNGQKEPEEPVIHQGKMELQVNF